MIEIVWRERGLMLAVQALLSIENIKLSFWQINKSPSGSLLDLHSIPNYLRDDDNWTGHCLPLSILLCLSICLSAPPERWALNNVSTPIREWLDCLQNIMMRILYCVICWLGRGVRNFSEDDRYWKCLIQWKQTLHSIKLSFVVAAASEDFIFQDLAKFGNFLHPPNVRKDN